MVDLCKFKDSLVYIMSSRIAKATPRIQKVFLPIVITAYLGDRARRLIYLNISCPFSGSSKSLFTFFL